ncbi:MAG: molybdate ABC transporter substrate-binding protein [Luteitalea sp.]|nr:molybdate ABC transporter substrate-binding protein [Luteitalea sp.]
MLRVMVAVVLAGMAVTPGLVAQQPPGIAAAANLKFALEEVAQQFGAQHGERVNLIFGSSGNLTRQIIDGAPFELFLSADEEFVNKLADAGLTRDRGVLYAVGRLVVFAPAGSPLKTDARLDGLRALLASGEVRRFAIANPEYAPYGRAAEAVLRAKGLWEQLRPSLILGESIAQAAQFATTGNAVGGLLAYSLVLAPPLRDKGTYALLSEADHPPLRQRMVRLERAGPIAERFYRYLQEPTARDVLRQYGFAAPGD